MLIKMAEKLIRQYFYNRPSLKRRMKAILYRKKLSFSEWVRRKEREEIQAIPEKTDPTAV